MGYLVSAEVGPVDSVTPDPCPEIKSLFFPILNRVELMRPYSNQVAAQGNNGEDAPVAVFPESSAFR